MRKTNVIVPLAGRGQRFVDAGYNIPKSLILAKGKHFVDWSLQSIDIENCNLIFVVRNEHVCSYAIDEVLKEKYGPDIKVVKTYGDTKGSVDSCLHARRYIDNDDPLIVYCIDIYFEQYFNPSTVDPELDGLLLTFKSNSPNYSYSEVDENGRVVKVAEKVAISNNANVGLYYFKKGHDFVECSEDMMKRNLTVNGEYYIAPVYNLMAEKGKNVGIKEVERMYVMGTPRELDFFENTAMNHFGLGTVALCCDHSGFGLKELAKKVLSAKGIDFIDFGTLVNVNCDQVDYTKLACKSIQKKQCTHGLGFCRTGQAVNIAANKHKKVKGALIFNEYMAQHAVEHNGANFFSIPSKYVADESTLEKIVDTLMKSQFQGGRHQVRVQKIEDIENDC